MSLIKFFISSTATANLFIILMMSIVSPGSKAVILSSLILLCMTLPMVLFIFFNKLRTYSINSALISVFLIFLEVLFFFRIVEHPSVITWKVKDESINVIEFLNESPFIKFRPNSLIKSKGARGKDFTYEWLTDIYGFKNKEYLTSNFDINYIALGDSFTEAMGVSTDDTWTNKISKKSSIKVYNAGVQGYSASQMKGTYINLINKISHKGIIIGALPTIYEREETFSSMDLAVKQMGVGGIRSIAKNIKNNQNSFLVGFLRALKSKFPKQSKFEIINEININKDLIVKYQSEIPETLIDENYLSKNENWKNYVKNLKEISKIANNNNKEVILIQFPHRHELYFSAKAQGLKSIFESQYYIELKLLKKELPKKVIILDMYPFLKKHWEKNKKLIYFEKDGHMNELGNELVAKFLLKYLKT